MAEFKAVIEKLYKPGKYFTMGDILDYKRANPDVFQINSHILRNEGLKI